MCVRPHAKWRLWSSHHQQAKPLVRPAGYAPPGLCETHLPDFVGADAGSIRPDLAFFYTDTEYPGRIVVGRVWRQERGPAPPIDYSAFSDTASDAEAPER